MRLITYDDWRVGVVTGDRITDVTGVLPDGARPDGRMVALIASYDLLRPRIEELSRADTALTLSEVSLRAPLVPGKIVGAPANYRDHTREMVEMAGEQVIEKFKGFLKAPSSVIGMHEAIEIPIEDRRTDYEGELGVVIGRSARRVRTREALGYVFGYVPLLDMTIRGEEDRSFRKSADTFTPLGPAIVTADEVGNPRDLRLKLWLNRQLRQDACTADMVWDVPTLIERYSEVMTLAPGDLIATGTPAGVGEVTAGDAIRLEIERVGTLEMKVAGEPSRA